MEVLYQCIGFLALFCIGFSFYQKSKRLLIFWQVAAGFFFGLHYYLIGAYSAVYCSGLQIVVLFSFLLTEKLKWSKLINLFFMIIAYVLLIVFTYKTPIDLLSIGASLVGMIPLFSKNQQVIRLFGILSDIMWLVYGAFVLSYSGMITNGILAVVTFIAFIRYRKVSKAGDDDVKGI